MECFTRTHLLVYQLCTNIVIVNFTLHFTDITPSFFTAARDKFTEWEEKMAFKAFDVTKNPLSQNFTNDDVYDLIIASEVIHATPGT